MYTHTPCVFVCFRLVFSQSLLSLDLIEDFLALKTEEATEQNVSAEVVNCLTVSFNLAVSLLACRVPVADEYQVYCCYKPPPRHSTAILPADGQLRRQPHPRFLLPVRYPCICVTARQH